MSGALRAAGYPTVAQRLRLAVVGMTCASRVSKGEKALLAVPGGLAATVNLATGEATVTALSSDPAPLQAAVAGLGYTSEPVGDRAVPVVVGR